jgi:DNA-binding beta-propeller fold protein YncE
MSKKILVLALLAACGDSNHPNTPDAPQGIDDAPVDASMPVPQAVVLGADFSSSTGVVSKLDVTAMTMTPNAVSGAAGSDPVIRHVDDKLYIVNRSVGENVTILDAKTLALANQLSTGAGSDPQDVAVVGNKLYIPATGTAGVVVMTLPAGTTTTIALDTAVGDPDGKPDCVSAFAVGTDVYVACDLLDSSFTPRGPGKVAVIDTATDTVRTTITLPEKNPLGFFQQSPATSMFGGDLLIATVPAFDTYTAGCLVRVTPGTTPTATCATGLHNSDLAGFVNAIAIGASKLYLSVVVDQSFSTASGQVREVNLATGALSAMPLSSASEQITDLAACPDGSIVAIDSTMNANGVRVYQGAAERTTMPIAIGLPPVFSTGIVCYDAR